MKTFCYPVIYRNCGTKVETRNFSWIILIFTEFINNTPGTTIEKLKKKNNLPHLKNLLYVNSKYMGRVLTSSKLTISKSSCYKSLQNSLKSIHESLFCSKTAALEPTSLIRKDSATSDFSGIFAKLLKQLFFTIPVNDFYRVFLVHTWQVSSISLHW